MHFELEHLGTPTPLELPEGVHLLGGGPEDQVRLEGLPPGLMTLRVEHDRLFVEATRPFTVSGLRVPPALSRLVLPGEVVRLSEQLRLKVLPPGTGEGRQVGTAVVLKQLLLEPEGVAPSRAATLTCLTGADMGRTFALSEASTDIGRGSGIPVCLRDRTVSRRHARIRYQEGIFLLESLGSPNGLALNGRDVEGPSPLAEGDLIGAGRSLLRFQAAISEPPLPQDAPPAAEASPGPSTFQAEDSAPRPSLTVSPVSPAQRQRPRWEGWLIHLGMGMALTGLLTTYLLTR